MNRSIDYPIPRCASIWLGGPLANDIDDPSRWLVCNGVKPVSMSSADLLVEGDVAGKKVVPTVDGLGGSSLFNLCFQDG